MRKVKLSWEDQIKIKEEKKEEELNLQQLEQHQSMVAHVNKKSTTADSKSADYYDSYIIEKALSSLKKEIDKQSLKIIDISEEDMKNELEFHEQYFS